MSLTAIHSTSGASSRAIAARNRFRPMRPNPWIPTRTGMRCLLERERTMPGPGSRGSRPGVPRRLSGATRRLVDVAVGDGHVDVLVVAVALGEMLGDRHRPVTAAGAAD